ncbi:DUF6126 family protein [Streptomyces sp. Ac-502]|uniref:DUF6126 family protein n=1 Tax=Streptomyces sp. Ac-502 TaxID=3342801 RepID=UPI003862A35D
MSDDPTPQAVPGATPAPARKYVENKPPRGVYVRVFIYVVATHVLLAFMSIIFIIAKNR